MIQHDEWGPEKVLEVWDSNTGMHGWLVIDNRILGPAKGGIRMTPTITAEEVFRLARTMTWKCAAAGLPFGGGKSGIAADPSKLSTKQKKEIIQAFARAIKPLCPSQYIAGPDMGTGEQEMGWFAQAVGSWRACTGKPATMCVKPGVKCGIPHEYGSTGFGVAHSTVIALEHAGLDLKKTTIAIEGFGNVGSFAAKFLSEFGAKVVAVSDSKGCIYNSEGLDFGRLEKVKKATGSVINYTPGRILRGEELFELPVDVLIPAAQPDVINEKNVDRIKAKIIVEAANIPATPEIEERLHKRGILVVPDFVANAGGVISSYAEYRGYNPKQMFRLVERRIRANTALVLERARKAGIKPRDAAMEIAIERIKEKRIK